MPLYVCFSEPMRESPSWPAFFAPAQASQPHPYSRTRSSLFLRSNPVDHPQDPGYDVDQCRKRGLREESVRMAPSYCTTRLSARVPRHIHFPVISLLLNERKGAKRGGRLTVDARISRAPDSRRDGLSNIALGCADGAEHLHPLDRHCRWDDPGGQQVDAMAAAREYWPQVAQQAPRPVLGRRVRRHDGYVEVRGQAGDQQERLGRRGRGCFLSGGRHLEVELGELGGEGEADGVDLPCVGRGLGWVVVE